MTLISAIILLFLVIDPFGNVPFFVAALKEVEPVRRKRVIVRELLIAYAIMVASCLWATRCCTCLASPARH